MVDSFRREPLGIQAFTLPHLFVNAPEVVHLVFGRDEGQAEMLPAAPVQDMAGEVLHVQALHHNDDDAGFLIVQAGDEGLIEPVVGSGAVGLGEGLRGIQGVVHDEVIAALACRGPPLPTWRCGARASW